ncbi:MAG: DUF3078 domain-containing protein [Muribaculaceae bacterium]|nr:DUF3078 domain-containing protein [Muribaculaceae bacterium]
MKKRLSISLPAMVSIILFSSLSLAAQEAPENGISLFGFPRIFRGYRYVRPPKPLIADTTLTPGLFKELYFRHVPDTVERVVYSPVADEDNPWDLADLPKGERDSVIVKEAVEYQISPVITGDVVPEWLTHAAESFRRQADMIYLGMLEHPLPTDKAFWHLPVPPSMPVEEVSYYSFLKNQHFNLGLESAGGTPTEIEKVHWLHVFNIGVQFSQAYLSRNWYQGGNNYLSLLGNFLWDVQLNQVFHPNMMFQSTLSYKLGLNSTADNPIHKYSISEDLFQYNLKAGYKAAHHWYYSFTTQFKTQLLNSYPSDSMDRMASFLTPATLTLGLGMTYTKENVKKTVVFNASISPLSYNLKTAIDPHVDHSIFGMAQNVKTVSEFGSTAELTLNWKIWDNILYKTRLFLFTDYKQSNADWQNTLEFQFNRFFSTQLYINLRYDSTADKSIDPKWKRWMMKEILSVGLSYSFSTK